MKYLFLIIRHLFPRHKWDHIATRDIYIVDSVNDTLPGNPDHQIYVLRDQFGNIKTQRIG